MEPSGVAQEPISSELALVDGELARRARAALPDPPWLLPALAELEEVRRAEPPPRRRSLARRLRAAALVVLALLALGALASSFVPSQSPSLVSEPGRRASVPVQTTSTPSPAAALKPPTTRANVRHSRKPAPAAPATSVRTTRSRSRSAAKQMPKQTTRTLPKTERVLRWRRYAPAAFYVLALRRGQRTIYKAKTTRLTATMPGRLKLRPGTYRVLVRPAVPVDAGIVFGPAVLHKTIKV